MAGGPARGGNRRPRYACTGAQAGATAADARCQLSVLAPPVEAAVLAAAGAAVAALDRPAGEARRALERAWNAVRGPGRRAADALRVDHRRAEAERESARRGLAAAAVKLVEGELDRTGYDLAKAVFERRLAAAQATLADLRARSGPGASPERALPPLAEVLSKAGGWAAVLESAGTAAQREVLALLVERVVPVREKPGRYRVDITWTPLGDALGRMARYRGPGEAA